MGRRRGRQGRAGPAPEVERGAGADAAPAGNTKRRGGALLQKGRNRTACPLQALKLAIQTRFLFPHLKKIVLGLAKN